MKQIFRIFIFSILAFTAGKYSATAQNSDVNTLINKGVELEESGDIAGAEKMYVQAGELGAPTGWILAGNLYSPGFSKTPNAQKAIQYLEKGILYDQRAAPLLAMTYYLGDENTEPNYQKALIYLKKASEMGMAQANGIVGTIYVMGGYGVAPDPDQALLWLMPAAENGDANAMFNYGLLLINGTQSLEPDPQEGLMYIKQAAAKGHKGAQKYLTDSGDNW